MNIPVYCTVRNKSIFRLDLFKNCKLANPNFLEYEEKFNQQILLPKVSDVHQEYVGIRIYKN